MRLLGKNIEEEDTILSNTQNEEPPLASTQSDIHGYFYILRRLRYGILESSLTKNYQKMYDFLWELYGQLIPHYKDEEAKRHIQLFAESQQHINQAIMAERNKELQTSTEERALAKRKLDIIKHEQVLIMSRQNLLHYSKERILAIENFGE